MVVRTAHLGTVRMYIYLHVPFCVSRCIYCDFYVVLEKHGGKDAYVDAVCREIALRFAEINASDFPEGIQTLYVGGGTPSLLPVSAYQRIFEALNRYLPFAKNAEITIEANPGGPFLQSAEAYLELGFNRISVGVQSLNDRELKRLSRIHSAAEAKHFIQRLQQVGWRNISVDLMYALPKQTLEDWRETLRQVVTLEVQHVSMYGLKVEEGTPLETLGQHPVAKASYAVPSDDENVAMYFEGLAMLEAAGFRRYEFSNLAKPGCESRHNLNYWNQGDFLALGVAAHGYWNGVRYETVRDLQAYLENPLAGERFPCEPEEQLENAIIFGLRKAEGIDIPALERVFGFDFQARYGHILTKYEGEFLERRAERLVLKEQAIQVSNVILSEFLI
ncbi:MAG TPA: radical SAM family heme chaperone HemW [Oculatellaceae cyanobacterium]|jgi:oxygen-independent coproporphyrinogen-3 oxidase